MMTPLQLPDVPFTYRDAERAGFNRWHFRQLLEGGRIRRVLCGVYQRADLPDTTEHRALAAALVMRPFEVLRDRTAAWLHGVDTFEFRELEILPPLETSVFRGHTRARRFGCVGGERDLRPEDVMFIQGIAVTTPLRTALDLGCRLRRRSALAALDGFMRAHGITRQQMEAELVRYRGRRGVVQLRELVPLADPRAESPGECWTRLEIIDAGLPTPIPQYWVREHGRKVFRLDLAYPMSRVAVEYDGREFHDSPEQEKADRLRRQWLREHGWTVIVVDKDSFTPEALALWFGELRSALRIAA